LGSGPDILGSLFTRKRRPSLFGQLCGWSFLFFDSPKRKQAKRHAYSLPQKIGEWLSVENEVGEIGVRVEQVEREASHSFDRAMVLRETIQKEPPVQLDAEDDRDIRIRLFQARNQILARIDPREIASSPLPQERRIALLNVAAQYREQRARTGGDRRGGTCHGSFVRYPSGCGNNLTVACMGSFACL
jgi:hypothetical protein